MARDTQAFVYEKAAQLEVALLKQLKSGGMIVNIANKQAFIDASAAIYAEYGTSVPGGRALVDETLSLAK